MDLVEEIASFLKEDKALQGSAPLWIQSPYAKELSATWNIEDASGIVRSQLRFRCLKRDRSCPSVSLIYKAHLVWRMDIVPATEGKWNPVDATYKGLPARIYGPHEHGWPDNRDFLAQSQDWHLPYRRPITANIRRLPQAMLSLAAQIKLTVSGEGARFDVPPITELFP